MTDGGDAPEKGRAKAATPGNVVRFAAGLCGPWIAGGPGTRQVGISARRPGLVRRQVNLHGLRKGVS